MRKSILILGGLVLIVTFLMIRARRFKPDPAALPSVRTALAPAPGGPSDERPAGGVAGATGPSSGQRAQPAQNPVPAPSAAAYQSNNRPNATLSESAVKQIQAFQTAKLARSAAQHKLDSNLIDADKMRRGEALAEGVTGVELDLPKDETGRVLVDIDATVSTTDRRESDERRRGQIRHPHGLEAQWSDTRGVQRRVRGLHG